MLRAKLHKFHITNATVIIKQIASFVRISIEMKHGVYAIEFY